MTDPFEVIRAIVKSGNVPVGSYAGECREDVLRILCDAGNLQVCVLDLKGRWGKCWDVAGFDKMGEPCMKWVGPEWMSRILFSDEGVYSYASLHIRDVTWKPHSFEKAMKQHASEALYMLFMGEAMSEAQPGEAYPQYEWMHRESFTLAALKSPYYESSLAFHAKVSKSMGWSKVISRQ